jgi:superfamily II DNA or RNA helicase
MTTLVIVPKDDLVKQWRERILQHTDIKATEIGRIQQNKCDVYGKKVVIASLKSLSIPDRYPPAIRQLFGLVVFDEVHRLGADTFQTCCRMFPAYLRLGLSATPDRKDGKEIVFYANIGPVRVISDGVPMVPKVLRYESGWKCPRTKKKDKITGETKIVKLPHSPGKCGHVVKYLLRDMDRNRLLVWLMMKAYKNKRNTVIFSSQIDHLELLRDLCVKSGVPRAAFGEYYGGGRSDAHLDQAAACPLVLATPGKAGDGTDFPWWDCCILAAPMAGIKQSAGRTLREYPDKLQPVIFDIDDSDSPVFSGYQNSRDEYYASVGAQVKEMQPSVADA